MINHPRGFIRLSPYREASSFRSGQEINFFFFSWSIKLITVLPWHYKPTNCSYRNLFGSIHCTIIRFAVIFFFHLRLFHPSDCFPFVWTYTLLNTLLTSHITVTCSTNYHLCSCHADDILWMDRILDLMLIGLYLENMLNLRITERHLSKLPDRYGVRPTSRQYTFLLRWIKRCK